MKKFFTLAIAALAALSVSAKEDIDISSIATNGVVTFDGQWQWKGITLSTSDESGETTYADKSDYDYVVFEYSAGDCGTVNVIAQYNPDGTTGQWGPNYYNTTVAQNVNINGGILAVQLDADHSDKVNAIALQNQGTTGTITVTSAYFATEDEYNAAKAEADKIEKVSVLDATGGTHTLAAKDWGWDSKWLDMDVTDFNSLVFEIASVTGHGQITAEAGAGTISPTSIDLPASTKPATYVFDLSQVTKLRQYAYQNLNKPDGQKADGSDYGKEDIEETTIVVTKVYLTSKTKDQITTGISNIKANTKVIYDANAPMYNLAGQRVSKSYKGVVIQNGHKFLNNK